jgi:hypothetical protein
MVRTSDLSSTRWHEILDAVAFAIRATFHTTLQASPCQLIFQRDMITNATFTANWAAIRTRKQRQVNIDNAHENSRRISHSYSENDLVLIKKDTTNLPKLACPTEGPFKIVQVKTNGTVVIERENFCETINIRRLLPYHSDDSQS